MTPTTPYARAHVPPPVVPVPMGLQERAIRVRQFLSRTPIAVSLGALSFVWFVIVAARCPIDVDEGFYAVAAELVANGKVPYRDFFYPQTPLLPYLLSPAVLLFGARFLALRMVSAFFAAVTAGLVAHGVHRETQSRLGALVAVVLFAGHELTWQWATTIRPYGAAEACAIGAFLLATPIGRDPRRVELMLAGALAVAAPLMRLPLAPVVGVVALAILLRGRGELFARSVFVFVFVTVGASVAVRPMMAAMVGTLLAVLVATLGAGALASLRRVAWFGLGVTLVGAVVVLPFVFLARKAFVYGVVGYHADTSTLVAWPATRPFLFAMLGGGSIGDMSGMGTQNMLLLFGNLVALALPRTELRVSALTGAAVLAIGNARHVPSIEHYATPIVPLLAIGAGVALGSFERAQSATAREWRFRLATLGGAAAVFVLASAASFDLKWGKAQYGGWSFKEYRPAALDRSTAALRALVETKRGGVLPLWPGSAFGSAPRIIGGYENQFARRVPEEHVNQLRSASASDDKARRLVVDRIPSVVLLDRDDAKKYVPVLEKANYVKATATGVIGDVYVKKDGAS